MKSLTLVVLTLVGLAPGSTVFADNDKAKQAEKPKAPIYDEKADAEVLLRTALANAKKENRRVLIQWGGNWCPWCHRIHTAFKTDRDVAKLLLYEYDLVLIDIGRREKNMSLAMHYGADLTKNGIPFLTVLDSDGKALVNQPGEPFEKKNKEEKGYDTAKLADFLKKHQPGHQDAETVLTAALKQAAGSDKNVFLHFGAPWCGWCRHLDSWLARPDITAIVARDFVELKIDVDRMNNGQELLKRYCASPGGIPWFVILDSHGKAIVDSVGPKGNIGFPAEDHEIEHFIKMVQKTRRGMTDSDIDHLRESLVARAKEVLQKR